MKRLVLNYKNKIQRVNFVLFKGTGHDTLPDNLWKNKTESLLKALDD
jgi:hypothetical protein